MDHLVTDEEDGDPLSMIRTTFMKLADLDKSQLIYKEKKYDLSKSIVYF